MLLGFSATGPVLKVFHLSGMMYVLFTSDELVALVETGRAAFCALFLVLEVRSQGRVDVLHSAVHQCLG